MGRRKRYRFHINGGEKLKYAPDGWDGVGYSWERNLKYFGLFRKYAVGLLNFPKDGKAQLDTIFENEGVDAEAELLVEVKDWSTRTYIEDFSGEFDYSLLKQKRLFTELGVIDSSFEEKIKNRENIKVNLSDLTSIDGSQLIGFTNEGIRVSLPSRIDNAFSNLEADRAAYFTSDHAIPLILLDAEDSDIRTVPDPSAGTGEDGSMLIATSDKVLNLSGTINLSVDFDNVGGGSVTIDMKVYDSGGSLVSTTPIVYEYIRSNGVITINTTYDKDITLNSGERLNFLVNLSGDDFIGTLTPYITTCEVKTTLDTIPAIQTISYLWHEVFARILQKYTGVNDPFYSDLLGRTDSEPRSYSVDGDESLNCFTDGKRIRQYDLTDSPFSISLTDAFKTLRATCNVAMGIEIIGGQKMVRLERLEHFFEPTVLLTFDNCKNIEGYVIADMIYNGIKNGFNKSAFEEREGILEYNNKSEWSTPIKKVDNDLDLVSPIRFDNAGITFARKLPKSEFPTTDSQYDKDNFGINLVRGTDLVTNGDFEDWTDPNTPVGWIKTATVLELDLLGSTRLQFISTGLDAINQSFAVTAGQELFINFAYKLINETASGTYNLGLIVTLDSTYFLKQDGSWSAFGDFINYASDIEATKQALVQSFDQYNVPMNAFPVSGNLQISFFSTTIPGLTLDNVTCGTGSFIARTDEGFDSISNTINDEKAFNVHFTPGRTIRTHGNVLRSFLGKYLNNYIRYITSENNVNVESQETGEDLIVENAEILINDLDPSLFDAYGYNMKTPITRAQKDILESTVNSKPATYGIIKFRENTSDPYKYGWIKIVNILSRNDKNEADFELLKVSDNVVIS